MAYLTASEAERGLVLKLTTYPTPATPVQATSAAVTESMGWLSAGEIYWQDRSATVWSASVSLNGGQIDVGAPKAMFDGRPLDKDVGIIAYDPPRERFLLKIEQSTREEPQLILVSDWRR